MAIRTAPSAPHVVGANSLRSCLHANALLSVVPSCLGVRMPHHFVLADLLFHPLIDPGAEDTCENWNCVKREAAHPSTRLYSAHNVRSRSSPNLNFKNW